MAIKSLTGKLATGLYLLIIHVLALLFIVEKIGSKPPAIPAGNADATSLLASPMSPDTSRMMNNRLSSSPSQQKLTSPYTSDAGPDKLMIPVVGVKKAELQDTYTQSRSGGRVHNATDIIAPGGTPVVAAADGEIAKFFDSKQGGTTVYQWSADKKRIYYYAHLQRRADGIAEKMFVKRGSIIGFVGDTGNAGTGNFHLHFSIIIPGSPDRYWEGTNINPYPVLQDGIETSAAGAE